MHKNIFVYQGESADGEDTMDYEVFGEEAGERLRRMSNGHGFSDLDSCTCTPGPTTMLAYRGTTRLGIMPSKDISGTVSLPERL